MSNTFETNPSNTKDLQEPLLDKETQPSDDDFIDLSTEEECRTGKILWDITKNAVPGLFGFFATMGVEIINTVFVGHLDDPAFTGGLGLGNIIINIFCFSIAFGLNGAIDTLAS